MKKIIYPLFCLFVANSCTNDRSEIYRSTEDKNNIESDKLTRSLLGDNFITNEGEYLSPNTEKGIIADYVTNRNLTQKIHGPYKITIPTPEYPYPSSIQVMYRSGNRYTRKGLYNVDIYNYYFKAKIPSNALRAWVQSVDNPGYSNYDLQGVGYNTSMTNENGIKYVTGNTYTMVLRSNMEGDLFNSILPYSSLKTPKTFTYYYLTNE